VVTPAANLIYHRADEAGDVFAPRIISAYLRHAALAIAPLVAAAGLAAVGQSPAGVWDATVVVSGLEIPFKFEIVQKGAAVSGAFFDGEIRVRSTGGRDEDGVLVLTFAQYGSRVEVAWAGDRLEGKYDRGTRGPAYPFRARRAVPASPPSGPVPAIAGEWRIQLPRGSSSGEQSWRFVVRQSGAQVSAAIMRVDGDTGTLSGSYEGGRFFLSHFSGARPEILEITPQRDGSLVMVEDRGTPMTAVRVTDVRVKAVPAPTDPRRYTTVKNPSERFHFSFPDLDGRTTSDSDPRFQGRVVIVSITGSWCPNCHDEAPFLARLYREYRGKGLEIVALAFEEADQLKNPSRVRAFIKQYGISYPFLLAGEPEQVGEKIPQAVNLNTFPATFVLGRDGRVRAVHAGYASKATGRFYELEQRAFLAEIDRLLAERDTKP
jgi:thiol-disulfide isomerase/thioredoxin